MDIFSTTVRYKLILAFASFSSLAHADLPLSLDELLTHQKQIRLELGLTYANSQYKGLVSGEPVLIQVSPAQFVTVPSQIGESNSFSDTQVFTLGGRYGVNSRTEIYSRLSAISTQNRRIVFNQPQYQQDDYVSDLWVGVNHVFIQEGKNPALLAFAELAAYEATPSESDSAKSLLIGFTTYRVSDPIVFSVTTAYRASAERKLTNGSFYTPNNYLLLNPSIGFAVNADVTLNFGWQWRNMTASKTDDHTNGLRQTITDLTLGAGWGLSKKSTVNFSIKSNLSGNEGAELGMNWVFKL